MATPIADFERTLDTFHLSLSPSEQRFAKAFFGTSSSPAIIPAQDPSLVAELDNEGTLLSNDGHRVLIALQTAPARVMVASVAEITDRHSPPLPSPGEHVILSGGKLRDISQEQAICEINSPAFAEFDKIRHEAIQTASNRFQAALELLDAEHTPRKARQSASLVPASQHAYLRNQSAKTTTTTASRRKSTAKTAEASDIGDGGTAVAVAEEIGAPVPNQPNQNNHAPTSVAKDAASDITTTQAKRQMDAMGNDTFRVALRGPEGIKGTYELTKDEVLNKIPYFKMMNVKGNDVLIKPIGESNVVMVDGLNKEAMNAIHLKDKGPAAAIEVAPDKYQVFVKVGDKPIPAQERREIAKELAGRFGGDQAAAAEGHYGRLAGFTNRDTVLTKENGKQPWVKIQSAKGEGLDDQEAAELLTSASVRVTEINKLLEQTRNKAIESFRDTKASGGELNSDSEKADPVVAFKVTAARLFERYGEGFDEVKADWIAAKDMSQKGWSKNDIAKAIEEASANVEPRKFDAMKDYANRTAGRAVAAVDNERTVDKSKSIDRGMER